MVEYKTDNGAKSFMTGKDKKPTHDIYGGGQIVEIGIAA